MLFGWQLAWPLSGVVFGLVLPTMGSRILRWIISLSCWVALVCTLLYPTVGRGAVGLTASLLVCTLALPMVCWVLHRYTGPMWT